MSTTAVEHASVLKLNPADNPTWNEKSALIEEHAARVSNEAYPDGDWRKKLLEDGYVVVKALSKETGQNYGDGARSIISSFGKLDYDDKSTWKIENMPDPSSINTFTDHCIAHEKEIWDIRKDKEIRSYFEKLWGTDELLVSFDALNVTFPGISKVSFWPHVDQSPYREGLQCVQGLVALSDAGEKDGGFVVYKGSNKMYRKFFDECTDRDDDTRWKALDIIDLEKKDVDWFVQKGCEEIKIDVEVGDLVLWDSRTIHFGKPPDTDSEIVRTVVYVCYTPAAWATEQDLKEKKEAFLEYRDTSHWPHANINAFAGSKVLSGNVEERTEPLHKIDYNDEDLLRLAGVTPY